ncbi:MAG: antitoxin [Burkholderiales bacterium]|nr:antitoxin [Burkholderiales bacterium]MBK9345862.1 antitoxin [Burkholderiales bacterium]
MRTTLDIADDVLFAAKEIAQREKKPLGTIISDLARRAFLNPAGAATGAPAAPPVSERLALYGINPLPSRGGIVSNELVDRLREAEGI